MAKCAENICMGVGGKQPTQKKKKWGGGQNAPEGYLQGSEAIKHMEGKKSGGEGQKNICEAGAKRLS